MWNFPWNRGRNKKHPYVGKLNDLLKIAIIVRNLLKSEFFYWFFLHHKKPCKTYRGYQMFRIGAVVHEHSIDCPQ